MKRVPFILMRRGMVLACCLAAVVFLAPGAARAGISGSLHDFVGGPHPNSIGTKGTCSVCHIPHNADPLSRMIWARPLSEERDFYTQDKTPNYLPGTTLLCYDCHDDNSSADADPASLDWNSGREPQDIALDGAAVGYYEMACGQVPGGVNTAPTDGSPTGGHYWKTEPSGTPDYAQGDKIACSLCHDPHRVATGTNESFFRATTWDGSATISLNQNGYGTDLTASANTREGTGTGRAMCGSCHGYSDQGSQLTLFNVTVPKPPAGVAEHKRDDGFGATACTICHGHNQIVGCSECHGYPPMLTAAEGGGTFDPNDTLKPNRKYVENYAGGAGAHRRHKDALDAIGSSIFNCDLCHGPNSGRPGNTNHNEGCGALVDGANVDISGLTAYWGAGSGYNGVATGGDATYAFATKGGGDQRCSGLACHGDPPNTFGALNWTDKMVDDATGDPVGDGLSICKWCHDKTPARIGAAGVWAPNVLGDNDGGTGAPGDWSTGTWGADVNGHGLAAGNYEKDLVGEATPAGVPAAKKQCAVCHDARYKTLDLPEVNTPEKPHFAPVDKRLRDTINGDTTIADNPDKTCAACHQAAAGLAHRATEDSQVVSHGNSQADGYKAWEPDQFVRSCRQCHEPHGSNWNGIGAEPRNLHMLGKWVDVNGNGQPDGGFMGAEAARVDSNATDNTVNIDTNDLPVITKSSGGFGVEDDSWDDGNNDDLSPPDSLCVVCHVTLENNHSQRGDWVAQGTGHLTVGAQCRLCHQHGKYPNTAPAAFGPLSCYACHGVAPAVAPPPGEIAGQFWPSGVASAVSEFTYANNDKGDHRKHIDAIGLQIFGEDAAAIMTDPYNFGKQLEICKFCHYDPGGADTTPDPVAHYVDVATDNSPLQRADVLQSAQPEGTLVGPQYFRKFTTGVNLTWGRTDFADDTTGGAYDFTSDSCANLVCHNQNSSPPAAGGTGTNFGWNSPPDWETGITSRCDNTTCHAAPATYTLAHDKHVGGGVGQKNYECRECHVDPTPNLQHGNGKVEMQWNNPLTVEGSFGGADGFYDKDKSAAASAGDSGFAYKDGVYDAPCVSIYCHGDDNATGQLPPADRGSDTTPQWGLPATAACGTCHGASAAAPPGDLSHPKHAGDAAGQYAIPCQACHYGTTTDGTAIASQTLHVNTSAEVSFDALGDSRVDATSVYGGDSVMGSGYGSCAATYCHSRGNDPVAPYNDVPLSVPIAPLPVWGVTGPLACSACHGNPGATPPNDASMPDYVDGTPKANKHEIHSATSQFTCQVCHYATTQAPDTIADTAVHVNGSSDVGPDAAGAALYQFSRSGSDCNAVVCHGGNDAIAWSAAGPFGCDTCHGMVGGAVTDTDVDDFAWAGATPTMSKISNAEYTADGGGHGDNTAPHQPNKLCAACHDSAVGHDTTAGLSGANPFRLRDQDGVSGGVQYSCSYATGCHDTGIAGPRTGLEISTFTTHTVAGMNPYTTLRTWPGWAASLACTNCHDPHGDGNLSMVTRSVYDKAAFALPGPAPAAPTEQVALSFTDDATGLGAGSFAWSTAGAPDYSGICQECHEDASVVSFRDGNDSTAGSVSASNHPATGASPGDCSACHKHNRGFAPKACDECHGSPPDEGINGGAGDDAPVVMTWYNVNGHGAKGVVCKDCHNIAAPDPSTHLTGVYETYNFPGSSFGAPNTNTAHLRAEYVGTVVQERDWQLNFDNNCYKNASCHGNPPARGHRHELTHGDGVVRFGDHSAVANPKQDRSPVTYWTPWTIADLFSDAPPPTNSYGPCVACHDPHGADYSGYTNCSDTPDGNHHMLRKNNCDFDYFCNSNCHRR